eukprot:15069153-Ditylum_brightwellii.AAC.1
MLCQWQKKRRVTTSSTSSLALNYLQRKSADDIPIDEGMEIVEATSNEGPDYHLHIQDKDNEAKKAVITKEDKRGGNSKQDNEQSPANRE